MVNQRRTSANSKGWPMSNGGRGRDSWHVSPLHRAAPARAARSGRSSRRPRRSGPSSRGMAMHRPCGGPSVTDHSVSDSSWIRRRWVWAGPARSDQHRMITVSGPGTGVELQRSRAVGVVLGELHGGERMTGGPPPPRSPIGQQQVLWPGSWCSTGLGSQRPWSPASTRCSTWWQHRRERPRRRPTWLPPTPGRNGCADLLRPRGESMRVPLLVGWFRVGHRLMTPPTSR